MVVVVSPTQNGARSSLFTADLKGWAQLEWGTGGSTQIIRAFEASKPPLLKIVECGPRPEALQVMFGSKVGLTLGQYDRNANDAVQ